MKTGAVALIDALEFRGIWERHQPDDILAELNIAGRQNLGVAPVFLQGFKAGNHIEQLFVDGFLSNTVQPAA
jgi:hypothetical protein